jgi:hypothetical protein
VLPEYPAAVWMCAICAVLLMGVAKAGFGGGIGIIATPLLALTLPVADAAALMLPLLIACDVFAVRHYYQTFDGKSVTRLLPGALLGIGVGAFLFGYFSQHERVLEVGLGVLALVFVLFQFGRTFILGAMGKRHPSVFEGVVMGAISGFTSTLAHAGAPPVVMYLLPQQLPRKIFVGTTVVFFSALNLIKVPLYWGLGLFHLDIFKMTLLLAPLAYIAVKLGVFLNARFTDLWFNRVVYGVLVLTAVQLIVGGSLLDLVF